MQKKLWFLIGIFFTVLVAQAQDFALDSSFTVDSGMTKKYRLFENADIQPLSCASEILRGTNSLKKSNFLSGLKVDLKSVFSSDDWKLDSIVTTGWNEEMDQVRPEYRQLFYTLSENREFEIRNYQMDEEKGHWIIDEAQYYNFSESGLLDSVEFQTHVTVNYILYTRFLYTYEDGRLHSEISQEKFDEFDDWKWLTRLVYEYDSVGNLTKVSTQERDALSNSYWVTYEYVEYAYDSMNNLERETYYDYDDYGMVSTKTSELLYSYDEQNRLQSVVEYVEGWQSGTFVAEAKQEYTYNDEGQLILKTILKWDYDLDDWIGYERESQTFNTNENTLLILETEYWDNGWNMRDQAVYETLNTIEQDNILSTDFIFSFLPVYEQDGIVCERISNFELESSDWQDRGETNYYFSHNWPVSVPTENLASIQIYPNPASDYLVIKSGQNKSVKVIVRDMTGRTLISKNIDTKDVIDIRSVTSGVYLIELRKDGQRIYSDKIIKK